MKRVLFFILLLLAAFAPAVSQRNESWGTMKATFGSVRLPDGTYQNVTGREVPFHAVRIGDAPGMNEIPIPGNDLVTAYHNDNGDSSHFASGGPMPSSLDDIVMTSAGQGAPWRLLTVFWNIEATQQFLVRWQVFDTHVPGLPSGESSFSGVIADFGGFFSRPEPGFWMITFDIGGQINVTVPDGGCFFAQQFREPDPSGEGAFIPFVQPGFGGGGVAVGSSDDVFWFDANPEDGIYHDDEQDNFGGPPNEANFLLKIEVGGTQTVLTPVSFSFFRGSLIGGDLGSLWYSDDDRLRGRPGVVFSTAEFPMQLIAETIAPSNNILTLKFTLEARTSVANMTQRIELFNFVSNSWVQVDSRPSSTSDSTVEVIVTQNIDQYVNSQNRRMRAKISFKPTSTVFVYPWIASLDRTVWTVTTP
ncbi:MAG: hypothetical protein H0W86_11740 [Armatimonadetes bacterium]|nr:hypothetical protein [Armatimonadota bacterium]